MHLHCFDHATWAGLTSINHMVKPSIAYRAIIGLLVLDTEIRTWRKEYKMYEWEQRSFGL